MVTPKPTKRAALLHHLQQMRASSRPTQSLQSLPSDNEVVGTLANRPRLFLPSADRLPVHSFLGSVFVRRLSQH